MAPERRRAISGHSNEAMGLGGGGATILRCGFLFVFFGGGCSFVCFCNKSNVLRILSPTILESN